ncbi:ferredoxin [Rhodococcus sp. NPDC057014]|uniref:ferredoxin n=1 Tax=Rhodococcus sp. NPDC057014 TaxID=3346000 RepID=UPI00362C5189
MTTGKCRVVVDMAKCSGLGLCEAVSPDVFEIDDTGHLVVHAHEVDTERAAELEEAAAACPTQAITIEVDAEQ